MLHAQVNFCGSFKYAVYNTTPLSILRRIKEGQTPCKMIRLTLWALGETEEAVEPATEGWQCPATVFFFLPQELQEPIREKT